MKFCFDLAGMIIKGIKLLLRNYDDAEKGSYYRR
jgi:hypothetical protein